MIENDLELENIVLTGSLGGKASLRIYLIRDINDKKR